MVFLHWIIAIGIGLVVGVAIGLLARNDNWKYVSSAGAVGVVLGFLIGITASPVVAAALAAGFTFASAVFARAWDRPSVDTALPKKEVVNTTTTEEETNGKKTTTVEIEKTTELHSRQRRPNLEIDSGWLIALVTGVLIGVLLGVVVRTNRILHFRDPSLTARLKELDFSDAEIGTIKRRFSEEMTLSDFHRLAGESPAWVIAATSDEADTPTAAQHRDKLSEPPDESARESDWWKSYWRNVLEENHPNQMEQAREILDDLADHDKVPVPIRLLIKQARENGQLTDLELLDCWKIVTTGDKPSQGE